MMYINCDLWEVDQFDSFIGKPIFVSWNVPGILLEVNPHHSQPLRVQQCKTGREFNYDIEGTRVAIMDVEAATMPDEHLEDLLRLHVRVYCGSDMVRTEHLNDVRTAMQRNPLARMSEVYKYLLAWDVLARWAVTEPGTAPDLELETAMLEDEDVCFMVLFFHTLKRLGHAGQMEKKDLYQYSRFNCNWSLMHQIIGDNQA